MEQLDLLRVTTLDAAVSPIPAALAKSEERDRELFELHAERLNSKALDVLAYQMIYEAGRICTGDCGMTPEITGFF
jgi:hypothetical protein